MGKRVLEQEFKDRSNSQHGKGRYDYSEIVYVNTSVKVQIKCNECGNVWQTRPVDHMKGYGCGVCNTSWNNRKRPTTESFIDASKEVHGEQFLYTDTVYEAAKKKLLIGCRKHGNFLQTPNSHLRGAGCLKCSNEARVEGNRQSQEHFLKKATALGKDYSYHKSDYISAKGKLTVTCNKHGDFLIAPTHLYSGKGCPVCNPSALKTTKEFIEDAVAAKGDRFSYDLVEYKGTLERVVIACKMHGVFTTTPANHLVSNSGGCKGCANGSTGYSSDKQGHLYILTYEQGVKIGITNKGAAHRCGRICDRSNIDFKVAADFKFKNGAIARALETSMLRCIRATYSNPEEKFDGSSETFVGLSVENAYTYLAEALEKVVGLDGELI